MNDIMIIKLLQPVMYIIALSGSFAWGYFYKKAFKKKSVLTEGFGALTLVCSLGILGAFLLFMYYAGQRPFSWEIMHLPVMLAIVFGIGSCVIFSAYRHPIIAATIVSMLFFIVGGANSLTVWIIPITGVYYGLFCAVKSAR